MQYSQPATRVVSRRVALRALSRLISSHPRSLSPEDDRFLDQLERANCLYFWEQADLRTGLVRDRCEANAEGFAGRRNVASIAATGFGLTALCIASERGFVPAAEARERAAAALRFLAWEMPAEHGFYYHWADVKSGGRIWNSEVSSIDTAILLCGVLTCRAYFGDREIARLATHIFDRVDWGWLASRAGLISHGWRPETGQLACMWDCYSELMMLYLLGLGSATYPLPVRSWHAWRRGVIEYGGLRYIGSDAPLFAHQYSHAWFDFRQKRDRYADYFENSKRATEAHRRFCLDLSARFPHISEELWGITASDSRNGYVVWGGPPLTGPVDGTIVPSAAAGSLPFLPEETLRVLRTIRQRYGRGAWGRYGFVNAFHPGDGWYGPDVVGIDTGITLVMAENLRSGFVWETFGGNPEVERGLERAGFRA
ncbi:MAG: hypothetical protein IT168_17305 [Bryobacterales bacterium]|nr:hypothetical protein [Bryobacterales bacterium]